MNNFVFSQDPLLFHSFIPRQENIFQDSNELIYKGTVDMNKSKGYLVLKYERSSVNHISRFIF